MESEIVSQDDEQSEDSDHEFGLTWINDIDTNPSIDFANDYFYTLYSIPEPTVETIEPNPSFTALPNQFKTETVIQAVPTPNVGTTGTNMYGLSRQVSNVRDAWKEYTRGLNGNPSIKDLEAQYGHKWRITNGDRGYYYARKRIYDIVEKLIRTGLKEDEAVADVEKFRQHHNWSLSRLQSQLKKFDVRNEILASGINISVTYNLLRNLTTVPQVWQEYTIGIYGNPSVRSLDMEYGSIWRNSTVADKIYSGRKAIYSAIGSLIADGINEKEAVNEIESMRKKNFWDLWHLQFVLSQKQSSKIINGPQIPVYRQYRNLNSVTEIWNEYKVGINGYPSVESMDANYGPRWRGNPQDRTFYYRRKKIYTAVETLASHGMSEDEAAKSLDKFLTETRHSPPWLEDNGLAAVEQLLSRRTISQSALHTNQPRKVSESA